MPGEPTECDFHAVRAWDLPIRLFHWINALSVIVLIAGGLVVMNIGALGIPPRGALVLKQIHVWAGYVFTLNLALRMLWAFVGSPNARWSAFLPNRHRLLESLRAELHVLARGSALVHAGHSAGGRVAISIMFILLGLLAATGLVLAGTDIYYPPFGRYFAEWVAAPGIDPAAVVPYEPDLVTLSAFYEVRDFRRPLIIVHEYAFYALTGMIVLHVAAVVLIETRTGAALVSSMITGTKILPRDAQRTRMGEHASCGKADGD